MSAAEGTGAAVVAQATWLSQAGANARGTLSTLVRPRRRAVPWPSAGQMALAIAGAAVVVLAVMVTVDAWAIAQVPRLSTRFVDALNRFTDFGKGGFFLWPLGLALIALAVLSTS